MHEIINIEWWRLALASAFLLLPLGLLFAYRTGLGKATVIAVIRMFVQLSLVGFYLEYLFARNSIALNGLWILIMLMVAGFTIVRRSDLPTRRFLPAVLVGLLTSIVLAETVFLGFVLASPAALHARYVIPITGMLLGNSLQSNIIGLSAFHGGLKRRREYYEYLLACGATRREALLEFKSEAIRAAMNPAIATLSTIGLISLPGMMTGQILGGSSPLDAVKYQIMIMIAIFSGSVTALVLSMELSIRATLDDYDLPRTASN